MPWFVWYHNAVAVPAHLPQQLPSGLLSINVEEITCNVREQDDTMLHITNPRIKVLQGGAISHCCLGPL